MVPEVAGSNPVAHPGRRRRIVRSPPICRWAERPVDTAQGFAYDNGLPMIIGGGFRAGFGTRVRPLAGRFRIGFRWFGAPSQGLVPRRFLTIEVMRSGRALHRWATVSHRFSYRPGVIARRTKGSTNADSEHGIQLDPMFIRAIQAIYHGEFDPGSGRTLAACFIHASRTRTGCLHPEPSGERVSNT